MNTINIIATTISGSINDWKKIDRIEEEFGKHYKGKIKLYVVDSHKEAREKANALVQNGELIVVSAGGAGTFNSVLQGCRLPNGYPKNLRLAFLRKGSADLLGKVLKIPDNLKDAAKIIVNSIKDDKTIDSDVIGLTIDNKDYHFIGFSGVGAFGIVPYFTEGKFIKYYKGLLGYLFGDRGPFLFGVVLAIFSFYLKKIFQNKAFDISSSEFSINNAYYSNILILNGDLGKDFPIAKGMPLATNNFIVFLFKDKGILKTFNQLIHAWKGNLNEQKEEPGIQIIKTNELNISSSQSNPYLINIDGLLAKSNTQIKYKISDRIKLITG